MVHASACLCRPRGRSSIIIPAGGAAASAWGTFRDALARIEAAGQQVLLLVCIQQFLQFLPLTAFHRTPASSDPCKQPVIELSQQPCNMRCSHRLPSSWHGHTCRVASHFMHIQICLPKSVPSEVVFAKHAAPTVTVKIVAIQH